MSKTAKTLVLIDGNAIMHRAYHALPPLTSRDGRLVNAVYGFSTMLFKIIDDLKPDHLAVAFDTPVPTFRHIKYLGYQAHRPHTEEGLSGQFETVYEVLSQLKIPIFRLEGFEADDVIGTLAQKAARSPKIDRVIIVTGDRDLLQLVNPKTSLYMPQKGVSDYHLVHPEDVKQKLGIAPGQIVDYKALTGDASDNYPGVPGIGPKTAVNLITQYKNLKNIYRHLKEIPDTTSQKLTINHNLADLSRELATIVTDAPVELDFIATRFHPLDKQKAISVFSELGFKSLVSRLTGIGEKSQIKKLASSKNQLPLI